MSPTQRATTLTRPASTDEPEKVEDWRDQAECRNHDPEIFFTGITAEARAICKGCPVREICRDDAIATREFGGVRGGHTGKQLRVLARGQRPLLPGVTAANEARREQGAKKSAHIADMALKGLNSREIATELGITVENAREHLQALRLRGIIPDDAGRIVREINHGTRTGYAGHRHRKEKACDPCREAMVAYERVRRARLRAGLKERSA